MKTLKAKEPKPLSLVLTALSGVLLGAALAVSILLSRNVQIVSKAPEGPGKPGDYSTAHVPGRVAIDESANLRSSQGRIQRRSPGPVSFGEDEVNYFLDKLEFTSAEASEGEESAPAEGVDFGSLKVRLVGDQIFGSMRMVIDPNGSPFEVMLLAELAFENSDAGPELVVKNLRANSLPLPNVGGAVSSMVTSKVAALPWPEELVAMWENIKSIQVESSKLIAEVGLRRA